MTAYYWVGGGGDLAAPTGHLATTSGGTSTGTALTSADSLVIDDNSGTGTVTISNSAATSIASLDTTTRTTDALALSVPSLTILGNTLIGNTTTIDTGGGFLTLASGNLNLGPNTHSARITISSGGTTAVTLTGPLYTTGSFSLTNSSTTAAFDTNGFNITSGTVSLGTTGLTAQLRTTVWTIIPSALGVLSFSGKITADSATFILDDTGYTGTALTITGGAVATILVGEIIYKGTGSTTQLNINNFTNGVIKSLVSLKSGVSLVFGSNLFISHLKTTGSAGSLTSLKSSVAGTQRFFNISNLPGILYSDYLDVSDIGTNNRFYAGANSVNSGNNTATVLFSTVVQPLVIPISSTTATQYRVPYDWNSTDNSIECVGPGGRSDSGLGGAGGGGGAYSKVTNVALTTGTDIYSKSGASGATPQPTFVGQATYTGSISGTTLTVTAISLGVLRVGTYIGGAAEGTKIIALGTGTGGVGTYTLNISQTVASVTTGYICYAAPGDNAIPSAGGAGGSTTLSYGAVKFAGGTGAVSSGSNGGGGGGAAGPNGAGGNGLTTGQGGSTNGGAVAGILNSSGLVSSIWTSSVDGTVIGTATGASGDDGTTSYPGIPAGGGGGGSLITTSLIGGRGQIILTYTSTDISSGGGGGGTPADTSDMFFMF